MVIVTDIAKAISNSLKYFNEGNLEGALQLAREVVRAHPGAAAARILLAELLCFDDALEAADQQLELAGRVEPSHALQAAQFRQIVMAAAARQDFYHRGRIPSFFAPPTTAMQHRLRASIAYREQRWGDSVQALSDAESSERAISGVCDDVAFDELRDMDDLVGPVLEVLTGDGRYFWLGFEQIRELSFESATRPRDLYCRTCRLMTRDGTEGVIFVPVLYDGSANSSDPLANLGRSTTWLHKENAPVRGIGQRAWLVGTMDRAVMEVKHIRFDV